MFDDFGISNDIWGVYLLGRLQQYFSNNVIKNRRDSINKYRETRFLLWEDKIKNGLLLFSALFIIAHKFQQAAR